MKVKIKKDWDGDYNIYYLRPFYTWRYFANVYNYKDARKIASLLRKGFFKL